MHLPVDLQLCGCSTGLLGGRIWPGKCPLLPYDPGLAVARRHSWKLGDPENGLARVLIGTPDSPPPARELRWWSQITPVACPLFQALEKGWHSIMVCAWCHLGRCWTTRPLKSAIWHSVTEAGFPWETAVLLSAVPSVDRWMCCEELAQACRRFLMPPESAAGHLHKR